MMNSLSKPIIGFIGAGNMAAAIVRGLRVQGMPPEQIILVDRHDDKLASLQQELQVQVTTDLRACAVQVDVLILAVKPQSIFSLCEQIPDLCQNPKIIISVMAGVALPSLASLWQVSISKIIRVMPNTPALIQQGVVGLFADTECIASNREMVFGLLQSIGRCIWLNSDDDVDKITALSGSGPGYVLYILAQLYTWLQSQHSITKEIFLQQCLQAETFANSAVNRLIDAFEQAASHINLTTFDTKLATQTVIGTINLSQKSNQTLDELRHQVTSKGGTTAAGLNVLMQCDWSHCFAGECDFAAILTDAALAAYARAGQLSIELRNELLKK